MVLRDDDGTRGGAPPKGRTARTRNHHHHQHDLTTNEDDAKKKTCTGGSSARGVNVEPSLLGPPPTRPAKTAAAAARENITDSTFQDTHERPLAPEQSHPYSAGRPSAPPCLARIYRIFRPLASRRPDTVTPASLRGVVGSGVRGPFVPSSASAPFAAPAAARQHLDYALSNPLQNGLFSVPPRGGDICGRRWVRRGDSRYRPNAHLDGRPMFLPELSPTAPVHAQRSAFNLWISDGVVDGGRSGS